MSVRRGQFYSLNHLRRLIVPEPVLAWLKAGDDGVASLSSMSGAVLAGRTVTTTDVSAFRAAAQMQPPTVRCKALHTAGSTWLRLRIDSGMGLHNILASARVVFLRKPCFTPLTIILASGRHWFSRLWLRLSGYWRNFFKIINAFRAHILLLSVNCGPTY